jgi:hypothetical protein
VAEGLSTSQRKRWISDRSIGIAGVVIGILSIIVGLAFSYYFYKRSIEYRNLTFAIDPVRTAIVNSAEASDLTVLYKGNPVRNVDLSSIRVYVWNQGNKPIIAAARDVLRPIRFLFSGDAEIIDYRIVKISRPETEFTVDINPNEKRTLKIKFSILENNDGSAIQIIYAGRRNTGLNLDGSIVGQPEIRETPLYQSESARSLPYKVASFILGIIGGVGIIIIAESIRRNLAIRLRIILIMGGLGVIIAAVGAGVYLQPALAPYSEIPKSIVATGS